MYTKYFNDGLEDSIAELGSIKNKEWNGGFHKKKTMDEDNNYLVPFASRLIRL